ncbi:MAG: methyl-accepting chemotaxis protein, partial [Caulobacteraceae bacterium]
MIGFGAVLAVVAITSCLIFMRVTQLAETERLDQVSSGAIDLLDQLNWHQEALKASTRKFMMTGMDSERAKVDSDIAMIGKDISGLRLTLTGDAPQFLPILDRYAVVSNNYTHKLSGTVASMAADPSLRLKALQISANAPIGGILDKMSGQLRGEISNWSDTWMRKGQQAMSQVQTFVLAGLAACLVIGAAMAWAITRAIGRPMAEMTAAMRRLASGDNTVVVPAVGRKDEVGQMAETVQAFKAAAIEKLRLEGESSEQRRQAEAERVRNEAEKAEAARRQTLAMEGVATGLERLSDGDLVFRLSEPFSAEYEKLRSDFNAAMDKLQQAMSVVSTNAATIRSGAGEISSAAEDLSRRTEQQAASLEQTAAALDEITATVRKTAEGAVQARDAVSNAKSDAERSGVVVRQAVSAMSGIEQSSRQIGQII